MRRCWASTRRLYVKHRRRAGSEDLVADIRTALRDDAVGIYLYGSYVSGGFDPGVSDLDLVTVLARSAEEVNLATLGEMHTAFARGYPAWRDRIETVYVGADALGSFRTSRERLAVISPGEPFHLRDEPPADWVQNWYLVRETGVAMFGPAAESLIPPVAWPEFVAASRRYAASLAASDLDNVGAGQLAYAVLTICRAQRTVEGNEHASKQEAATCASARHPDRARLIDAALRCRRSRGTIGFEDVDTRSEAVEFIRRVAGQMSEAGSG